MFSLDESQLELLDQTATSAFGARLMAHWLSAHSQSASQFSPAELHAMAVAALANGLRRKNATEASIVLEADLLLSEAFSSRRSQH